MLITSDESFSFGHDVGSFHPKFCLFAFPFAFHVGGTSWERKAMHAYDLPRSSEASGATAHWPWMSLGTVVLVAEICSEYKKSTY